MTGESITPRAERRIRIVVTGGGTGGHVSPVIAVAQRLRAISDVELLWIGSHQGLERDAAGRLEVPFCAVRTGKLRRYASPSTLVDAVRVPFGIIDAAGELRRFRPDAIFSSGGFVGVPAVVAGRFLRVPSLTHEQTAHRGLSTRINSYFSDVIALSFAPQPSQVRMGRARVIVTGNPVRQVVLGGNASRALHHFGLVSELPIVYVTGGAQGAHAINESIRKAVPDLLKYTQVIHQCGPATGNGDLPRLLAARDGLPSALAARYRVVEYVGDEIGDLYAATSLVVGRAGAGTVADLAALGIPSILIPLPGAEEQRRNGLALASVGGAVMLSQEEASSATILDLVRTTIGNAEQLQRMGYAARTIAPRDAAEKLADELLRLASRST